MLAHELRTHVHFEDLIEPISHAFQEASAGRAHNGLLVLFPAERPDQGDVYVKTASNDVTIAKYIGRFS